MIVTYWGYVMSINPKSSEWDTWVCVVHGHNGVYIHHVEGVSEDDVTDKGKLYIDNMVAKQFEELNEKRGGGTDVIDPYSHIK